jgi:hypothetical protein
MPEQINSKRNMLRSMKKAAGQAFDTTLVVDNPDTL